MVRNPKRGMKVNVTDPKHCFSCGPDHINHAGSGVIISVGDSGRSNKVQMDEYPIERWWRCSSCIEEIKESFWTRLLKIWI